MLKENIILEAKEVTKSYYISKNNYLKVLKGIDIKIYENEIVSVIGKSGAGKSTLLHIIGTLDKPDSGEVFFKGKNLYNLKDKLLAQFRNKNIGFIFQFHHLLPEFTVLENVMIPSLIKGSSDDKYALELLNVVGLSDRIHHKPNEISGGEAQRAAIARALINSPDIILADEPTGNLDSENANSIIDLIFDLREKYNKTFVIVTHNEEFTQKCDRIIKMTDGKISNE